MRYCGICESQTNNIEFCDKCNENIIYGRKEIKKLLELKKIKHK